MPSKPSADAVPPIEPTPAGPPPVPVAAPPVPDVAPAAEVPPPPPAPPRVDPYASSPYPPAPNGYYPAGQYPAGAYPPGSYPVGYYTPPPPRGLALASMITGIAGAFFSLFEGLGLFPSIAAVITGHLARKRNPQARAMWLTGLICGYIGIGFSLIWIVVLIVIFSIAISAGISDSYSSGQ